MNTLLKAFSGDFSDLLDRAKNIFLNFSWKDVIEIVLLSVMLFFVLKFLKGRKVGAILLGIAICFVFLFVSKAFELDVIYTIFSAIIGSGPLVLIVLFQPEIREALEKLGSGTVGLANFSDRTKKKALYSDVIDNICEAVGDMAKNCVGAIIVIERNTRLGEEIDGGAILNADVKAQLLRNIFFKNAPLHDGAVIIRDGRIEAAGCVLPLTEQKGLDTNLGTRHRAAIGMSEKSDAIIIVVSEETGKISVAYDCKLIRDFTENELKNFLQKKLLKNYGNVAK